MCSSPKGRSSKPHNSKLDSLTSDMDYADYSKMVQRANESYEKCQREKALRKQSQHQTYAKPVKAHKKTKPTFWLYAINILDAFKKVFTFAIKSKESLS